MFEKIMSVVIYVPECVTNPLKPLSLPYMHAYPVLLSTILTFSSPSIIVGIIKKYSHFHRPPNTLLPLVGNLQPPF